MINGLPEPDDRDALIEATDPVWSLLAKSPLPQPDAWFTVRTLARCRNEGTVAKPRASKWGHPWRWAVGTGLGISLALLLLVQGHSPATTPPDAKGVQEAFEILAAIGPDTDAPPSPNNSSWQDSSF